MNVKMDLTELAWKEQLAYESATSGPDRRRRGHVGTPPMVADYISVLCGQLPEVSLVRVLDPGAGVGTLSAALCQQVLNLRSPRNLYVELWENDERLREHLRRTMRACQSALQEAGHRLDFKICADDFVLCNTGRTLFHPGIAPRFDLVIMNPPYYKVRKDSAHARAMSHLVHGQPNIYAFFMAVGSDLLEKGGRLVAITPRGYFNGPYFRQFRRWFLDRMAVKQIHLFESRKEAFRDAKVLQENVILVAEKQGTALDVLLTSSAGRDFRMIQKRFVPYEEVVGGVSGGHVIRFAANDRDRSLIAIMDRLPHRLDTLGLAISTGPVVSFRATEFLRDRRSHDTAPMFWLHNVRRFETTGMEKPGKPAHIVVTNRSKRLLVPADRYVLLRRFSSKEEKRRLVAGIIEASDSYSAWIGLENHLNYLYRPKSELTRMEALGLAAFFNSTFADQYFRAVSGNTQVNAAEIRGLPLPDMCTLAKIGGEVNASNGGQDAVDQFVGRALHLPDSLMAQVQEILP